MNRPDGSSNTPPLRSFCKASATRSPRYRAAACGRTFRGLLALIPFAGLAPGALLEFRSAWLQALPAWRALAWRMASCGCPRARRAGDIAPYLRFAGANFGGGLARGGRIFRAAGEESIHGIELGGGAAVHAAKAALHEGEQLIHVHVEVFANTGKDRLRVADHALEGAAHPEVAILAIEMFVGEIHRGEKLKVMVDRGAPDRTALAGSGLALGGRLAFGAACFGEVLEDGRDEVAAVAIFGGGHPEQAARALKDKALAAARR